MSTISSAAIGGAFPLLFGQTGAAAVGGGIGGAAGGLIGGQFWFCFIYCWYSYRFSNRSNR